MTWTDHATMSIAIPCNGFPLRVHQDPMRPQFWKAHAFTHSLPREFDSREAAKEAAYDLAKVLAAKLVEGLCG